MMQTRDAVEGLHNCREFSQPLEWLYQVMKTQEKSFLLLLLNNFPEKKRKTLYYGTCFAKKMLSKIQNVSLKIDTACL